MNNIKLFKDKRPITWKWLQFPAGEMHVTIDDYYQNISRSCVIEVNMCDRLIECLLLLTDAIRNHWGNINIILKMPYIPYGRQDRVANVGEPLSIRVLANIINSQDYSEVVTYDPHSDVTSALINNISIIPQEDFVANVPLTGENTVLVAPDAGAAKKAYKCAQDNGFTRVVQAGKIRDTETGNITDTVVYNTDGLGETNFLIVDDICDGGRTFIELAKKLREISDGVIYLYVTHGIFSKGFGELKRYISHIFVANPMNQYISIEKDFITIVKQRGK